MKIQGSNVSYVNYNRHAAIKREVPADAGSKAEAPGRSSGTAVSEQIPDARTVDFKKPLSAHLNSAEKGMLNTLFPKGNENFGVGAYQKHSVQQTSETARGKSIDVTL